MPAEKSDNEPTEAIVMLLGPTASGKSAAAMAIAQHYPVEIISMDSAQVYRGMDIGTAKPNANERAAVAHHLIDIIDPSQSYSAGRFASDAGALVKQIRDRGNKPLLVGGTMLYARALTHGLNELPPASPDIRRRLETAAREIGWPAMHARLARIDPATAARLEPTDAQRIQRALELFESTGQPMSQLLAPTARSSAGQQQFTAIALQPSDRKKLHERIASRFAKMMADGFEEEVRQLHARPDLNAALPAMRCVGYRQLWAWLDNGADPPARSAAIDSGIAATRQLAKRQLTWLRSMADKQVIDCLASDAETQAVNMAEQAWG